MHPKMNSIMIHCKSLGLSLLYFSYKITIVRLLTLGLEDILRDYK